MAADVSWERSRRSDLFDVALAAVMTVGAGVSLYIGSDPELSGDLADYDRPVGIALLGLVVAPLALRRRFPLAVPALVTAAFVPLQLLEIPETIMSLVAIFIALYTAGAYGGARRDLMRGLSAVAIFGMVAWSLIFNADEYSGRVPIQVVMGYNAFQVVFFLAAAWVLGDLVRNRREREATLLAQAEELRIAQVERAQQAVVAERVRIARELHDVVAHHVSVMGVQAGAARRVLDRQPDAVAGLLSSVEESSRQAVGELHRMLGLLRHDDESAERTKPSLAQLELLTEQMRQAGLGVTTAVEGDPTGLPDPVDLSAYRIVQEALTNTLKHAGPGASANVSVVRAARSLEIQVADDGGQPAQHSSGDHAPAGRANGDDRGRNPGHGLLGMRERVGLLGGELKVRRRPGGGFEVRAWLPLAQQGETP